MKFDIYIQPGAKKTGYAGEFDGKPKLKISAPPVEGAANEEIIKYISKKLKIAKSSVKIVAGLQNRNKTIEIDTEIEEKKVFELIFR